ncbi:MAG: hypothetical protein RL215_594, partial [Planctomycetota bacterium]
GLNEFCEEDAGCSNSFGGEADGFEPVANGDDVVLGEEGAVAGDTDEGEDIESEEWEGEEMEEGSEAESEVSSEGSPDEYGEGEFPDDGEIAAGEQDRWRHGDEFTERVGVIPVAEHPVPHLFSAEEGCGLDFGDSSAEVDKGEEELDESCGPDGEGWGHGCGASEFPAAEECID